MGGDAGGQFERQAGLSDASRTRQRQLASPREPLLELDHLPHPANETGKRER